MAGVTFWGSAPCSTNSPILVLSHFLGSRNRRLTVPPADSGRHLPSMHRELSAPARTNVIDFEVIIPSHLRGGDLLHVAHVQTHGGHFSGNGGLAPKGVMVTWRAQGTVGNSVASKPPLAVAMWWWNESNPPRDKLHWRKLDQKSQVK